MSVILALLVITNCNGCNINIEYRDFFQLEIDVSFSVAKQRPSAKRLSFEIEAKR